MLDVHPPEHPAHSWRDFFIHIATIVLGLVIAIGLEQTVVFIHDRHEITETRAALDQEHQDNIRIFHQNVRGHLTAQARLHNNIRVLTYLRDHPGTPREKLPGILAWPLGATEPVSSAWSTAQHTDVLSLLPADEVRRRTADYFQLEYAWQTYQPMLTQLARCTAFYAHEEDPTKLSPAEIAATLDCTQQALALETIYGDELSRIGRNKEYGPVPTWWGMIPYFRMDESAVWNHAHRDVQAITQKDITDALANDPAGPPPADKP